MQDITVRVAVLHELGRQSLNETLREVDAMHLTLDAGTILVGHSAGANLMLTLLEQAGTPIRASFLVAGYCLPTVHDEPTLKDSYDWGAIRRNGGEFTFLNSFNDPFKCDDRQGKTLFDHLGGTVILRNDGHFLAAKQPLLTTLVLAAARG